MFRIRRLHRTRVCVSPQLRNGRVEIVSVAKALNLKHNESLIMAIRANTGVTQMHAKILALFMDHVDMPISYKDLYVYLYQDATTGKLKKRCGRSIAVHMSTLRSVLRAMDVRLRPCIYEPSLPPDALADVPADVGNPCFRLSVVQAAKLRYQVYADRCYRSTDEQPQQTAQ